MATDSAVIRQLPLPLGVIPYAQVSCVFFLFILF
jgi:hypothetical protein